MSKHTPGPWVIGESAAMDGKICIDTALPYPNPKLPGPSEICVLLPIGIPGNMHEEAHANARLIAAAPELLEALEAFVRAIAPSFVDCHADAVKAIAKAKGETK